MAIKSNFKIKFNILIIDFANRINQLKKKNFGKICSTRIKKSLDELVLDLLDLSEYFCSIKEAKLFFNLLFKNSKSFGNLLNKWNKIVILFKIDKISVFIYEICFFLKF